MSSTVPFRKIKSKLEANGWWMDRINGSHHIFKKKGCPFHFTVAVHQGKCKLVYDRKADQAIADSSPKQP